MIIGYLILLITVIFFSFRNAVNPSSQNYSTVAKSHKTRSMGRISKNSKQASSSDHADRLRDQAKKLGKSDPEQGILLLKKLKGNSRRIFAKVFFEAWAEVAPEECFLCVSNWWEGDDLGFVNDAATVAVIWARQDPQKAATAIYEYIQSVHQTSEFHSSYLLVSALGQWSLAEPEQAFQWLRQLPEDFTEGSALSTVIQNWAQQDPLAALETSNEHGITRSERNLIYHAGLSEWSLTNPRQSASWLLEHVKPSDLVHLEQAVGTLSQNLFEQTQIDEVTAWIDQISEPEIKESAVVAVASLWGNSERTNENVLGTLASRLQESGDSAYGRGLYEASHSLSAQNPDAVTEWLNQQENFNSGTDQVIAGYLATVSGQQSFPELFAWSQKLTNSDIRDQQQYFLISQLSYQDEAAFQQWMQEYGDTLSPQTKSLLTK